MAYFKITPNDLPPSYTICPPDMSFDSLWAMLDGGYFPSIIHNKRASPGVDLGSIAWLGVDEDLYEILLDGLQSLRDYEANRIVEHSGWPLQKKRPLILNFFRNFRLNIVSNRTLKGAMLTICSIILFGDQDPKKRRRLKNSLSPGSLIFQAALKVRKKVRKMGFTEFEVTGQILSKDICLLHILDLQRRMSRWEEHNRKQFFTWMECAPCYYKPFPCIGKKHQLSLLFKSDLRNLKVHPEKVDLTEHWAEFEEVRERLLDTSFTRDWPVVGSL
ncbi:nonstructural protein [Nile warbler virus]|uniref:Nonstructural protein n=1 Tax=Nile warbler virus TaxID=2848001 RepID=I1T339_9VIRU|nr:nonstructural protein [Nile warbler virus]AEL29656.1 nonstructural protein [Nile warbler virus]